MKTYKIGDILLPLEDWLFGTPSYVEWEVINVDEEDVYLRVPNNGSKLKMGPLRVSKILVDTNFTHATKLHKLLKKVEE